MGNNVIPRQQGDDYQASFFWLQACKLYQPHTGAVKVEWESSSTAGFDDVVLHYNPAKLDEGDNIIIENYQVKFHVDHDRGFTCQALIDPSFIGAKVETILSRLYKFYKDDPGVSRSSRFYVINTWGVDTNDEFRRLITNGGAIRLEHLFDGGSENTIRGKVRKSWREHLGITSDNDLKEILRPLRIVHNYHDLKGLVDPLNDKLQLAGFKPVSADHRVTVYLELIRRLHAEGKTVFTKEDLLEICLREGLVVQQPEQKNDYYIIGIRSFSKGAETLDGEVHDLLCLLHKFSGRYILTETSWGEVYPQISDFAARALAVKKPLQVHLDTHLSIAFCLGYCLDFKYGAQVSVIQKTLKGKLLWVPEPERLPGAKPDVWNWTGQDINPSGKDIVIALSVTHDIADQVTKYTKDHLPDTSKIIYGAIQPGPSTTAIQDANHIVIAVQELIRHTRSKMGSPSTGLVVHIFMAAPNAFAFFLGQQSRPLGSLVLYEYDFERLQKGDYQPSIALPIL